MHEQRANHALAADQKGVGEQLATRLRAGDIDDHRNFRTHQLARTRFGRCLLASFVSYLLFS